MPGAGKVTVLLLLRKPHGAEAGEETARLRRTLRLRKEAFGDRVGRSRWANMAGQGLLGPYGGGNRQGECRSVLTVNDCHHAATFTTSGLCRKYFGVGGGEGITLECR